MGGDIPRSAWEDMRMHKPFTPVEVKSQLLAIVERRDNAIIDRETALKQLTALANNVADAEKRNA